MQIAFILSICFVLSHAGIHLTPSFVATTANVNTDQMMLIKNTNDFLISGFHSNTIGNVTVRILAPLQAVTITPSGPQRLGSISAGSNAIANFNINGPAGKYELVFEVNYRDENQNFRLVVKNYEFTINRQGATRDEADFSDNQFEREPTPEVSKRDVACPAGTSTSGNPNDIISAYCQFSGDLNDYTVNSWVFSVASGITFTSFTAKAVNIGTQVNGPYNMTLYPGTQGGTLSYVNQQFNFYEYGTGCGTFPLQLQATYKKGSSGPLYKWTANANITITPSCGCGCACSYTCRRDATEGRIMPLKN